MLVEKDDLGLSLSLSLPEARFPLQLNLTPLSFEIGSHSVPREVAASPEVEERMKLLGIDVRRAVPTELEINEDAGASSLNSTASVGSHGGKRNHDEEHDGRCCSRGASDEEDGEASRKKLRLSKDQSAVLEENFKENNTLNHKQKLELAKQLNLRPRQVEVWFQNRRARMKLKQTEVDCEFLKRCCENLTEENRRLQKEVQELRALKLSLQFCMHMTPPTTLTMCPSCERVAGPHPPAKVPRAEQQLFPRPIRPQFAAVGVPLAPIGLRPSFLHTPPQRS